MLVKQCPNFPGYGADDSGNVYSFIKMINSKGRYGGKWTVVDYPVKKLTMRLSSDGYLKVFITASRRTTKGVHQIVADAFIGCVPEGQEVRHLDGNKLNNTPSNLAYGTRLENCADRRAHGSYSWGNRHSCVSLTVSEGDAIRKMRASGALLKDISAAFGRGITVISRICHKKNFER